jgi:hypothetical protein
MVVLALGPDIKDSEATCESTGRRMAAGNEGELPASD